ncbi:MAG TPA: DUF2798 domain-containing protein [Gammaproteobacteria bacterium]
MPRFKPRHAPILLAFFTSLFMSSLMSMVITFVNLGPSSDFLARWLDAFALAFSVAFPAIMLVLPVARKLVGWLVDHPAS